MGTGWPVEGVPDFSRLLRKVGLFCSNYELAELCSAGQPRAAVPTWPFYWA
jgi:hypothetical protein